MDLKDQPVPEGQHLLEVDDLKMYFHTEDGVVRAVDGVSYTLDRGETLGVVGESGSGKSVTAMTIMGLISMPPGKIEGGDVRYRGRSILEMTEEEMQHIRGNDIAMIFQDPMTALNPTLTIGNQLMEPIMLHQNCNKKEAWTRAVDVLKRVGIAAPEKRMKDILISFPEVCAREQLCLEHIFLPMELHFLMNHLVHWIPLRKQQFTDGILKLCSILSYLQFL